jgi:cardiolipin synthase
MAKMGVALLLLALLGVIWPEFVAVPIGVIAGWIGLSLLVKAHRLRRGEAQEREDGDVGPS